MANVLPNSMQGIPERALVARFLCAFGCACALSAAILAAAVLPAYIEARSMLDEANAINTAHASEQDAARADRTVLAAAQKRASALAGVAQPGKLPDILTAISSTRTPGIGVTKVSYVRGSPNSAVTLEGTVSGRQAVQAYASALQASGSFIAVTLPLTALTQTETGTFSLTAKAI